MAVVAAVIGNLAIAVVKFTAGSITGSSAMISEGIHSLVDMGNGGLLLLGMREAKEPADKGHPFGHGKALYFWTLVVSVSIFGIGGGMSLYEGVSHIRHVAPEASTSDPTVSYIVLAISALIEGWSFSVAIRSFRKAKGDKNPWRYVRSTKDPSTYTVVLEDSAALLGLVFAFLGIFLGHLLKNPYLDGTACCSWVSPSSSRQRRKVCCWVKAQILRCLKTSAGVWSPNRQWSVRQRSSPCIWGRTRYLSTSV
jgi:cation diffusion facilitator family transporter